MCQKSQGENQGWNPDATHQQVCAAGVFRKEDLYLKRRWCQVQYLADQFWKRWSKEYLPLLQPRSKWHWERRNLSVGDIVLLVDDTCSRNAWPLARIIETFPNSDGCVTRVKVKTRVES